MQFSCDAHSQTALADLAQGRDSLSRHSAALADAAVLLSRVPLGPVEPAGLTILSAPPPALGMLDAPGAALPDLVEVSWATFIRAGLLEHLCTLTIGEEYFLRYGPDSSSVGVRMLASLTRIVAAIGSPDGGARIPVSVSFEPDLTGRRSVRARALIPASAQPGDVVVGALVSYAGVPLATTAPSCCVYRGIAMPQSYPDIGDPHWRAPAFSRCGVLYVPQKYCDVLPRFSPNGETLAPFVLAAAGLSPLCVAAAVADDAGLLLVGEETKDGSLAALDLHSGTLRWAAPGFEECCGIAVLPERGVAIASSYLNRGLYVHRLSDGARVASASLSSPMQVAADAATDTVYVSTSCNTVTAFRWNGGTLEPVEFVDPERGELRFVAVMPARGGGSSLTGHLVVGRRGSGELLVFALPGGDLVHKHSLAGVSVMGLAGDPGGTALAVCDAAARTVEVMGWPLPGSALDQ